MSKQRHYSIYIAMAVHVHEGTVLMSYSYGFTVPRIYDLFINARRNEWPLAISKVVHPTYDLDSSLETVLLGPYIKLSDL